MGSYERTVRRHFGRNGQTRPATGLEKVRVMREIIATDGFSQKVAYRALISVGVVQEIQRACARVKRDPIGDPKGFIKEVAMRTGIEPAICEHIRQVMAFCLREEVTRHFSVDWGAAKLPD